MAYNKVNWQDGEAGGTPLSANNLNIMDNGIAANDSAIASINTALGNKADKSEIPTVPTDISAFNNDVGYLTQHQDISGKQDKLVSGTNIKTVNGNSLLGSGNIVISGGGGGGSTVSYTPVVTSGEKLGTLNIDGANNDIYAPKVPTFNLDGTTLYITTN